MKKLDPTDKTDLFTPEYLQKIYDLQIKIESSKISLLGKNYTVNDFCYKPVSDQGCLITSPMDFWKMNLQEMINDTNIKKYIFLSYKTKTLELHFNLYKVLGIRPVNLVDNKFFIFPTYSPFKYLACLS